MITIAARTSIGKTIVGTQLAVSAILQKKKVLFFSLEMPTKEIIARMVCTHSQIPFHLIFPKLRDDKLTEEQKETFINTMKVINEHSEYINIIDKADSSLDYIRSKALEIQQESGLDMVILDYVQLITTNKPKQTDVERITEASRNMKLLAKTLNAPVVVLAQINREDKETANKIPTMADIRGSGSIANDSDIVIILHRKKGDTSDNPIGYLAIGKNRNGASDKIIEVEVRLDKMTFFDPGYQAKEKPKYIGMMPGEEPEYPVPNNEEENVFDSLF